MSDETTEEISSEEMPAPTEKTTLNGEITITFRRLHIYAILMPLVFVLGLGIGYLVWGPISGRGTNSAQAIEMANSLP